MKDNRAVAEFLQAVREVRRFAGEIVHHEVLDGREAVYADCEQPLTPFLVDMLATIGIPRLYSHQAAAIDAVRRGLNVLVTTPTASGKSLIYTLPVLESLVSEPEGIALYLFPLKALAQDQLRTVNGLIGHLPASLRPAAAIIDGDTPQHHRRGIRKKPPAILISNPDMLHLSLLGHHDRWANIWPRLKYVVVDEVHTYRGVFGSHMAWVLRRLKRLCSLYGSEPVFILASATIGNPREFGQTLLGAELTVVAGSGAPQARRDFLFFDPLHSAGHSATLLLEEAIRKNLRTIVYSQSRKMAELVSVWTQKRLGDLAVRLSPYRAGFLPEERREIERKLASGELSGVVSTSALELGIDIGELDLCLLLGYPGSVTTTWQRGGRVGRRQQESAIVMIGQEDALDQYFLRNPGEFFCREVESVTINPDNPVIAGQHLVCAAAERPLEAGEEMFPENEVARRSVSTLLAEGKLLASADGSRLLSGRKHPHREVDLRAAGQSFSIYSDADQRLLGAVDGNRALKECHPGAVYLHRGQTWLVASLDFEKREITAVRRNVKYFTRPMVEKQTEIIQVHRTGNFPGFAAGFGILRVTETVTGFERRLVSGQRLIGREELMLPPCVFETEGLWIVIPESLQRQVEHRMLHFMGGIHALEHAAIGIFPLLVLCDRNDIGGISQPAHPQLLIQGSPDAQSQAQLNGAVSSGGNGAAAVQASVGDARNAKGQPEVFAPGAPPMFASVGSAAVFIYDGQPGGAGLSRVAFEKITELLTKTLDVIAGCRCSNGCPSCVHSPKCGSGNRPIDKEAAVMLVRGLCVDAAAHGPMAVASVGVDAPIDPGVLAAENKGGLITSWAAVSDREPSFHYGVFDLETQKSAEEVGGWHQAERMGVSIAVLYDSKSGEFLYYKEKDIADFMARLTSFDLVVGFNSRRFDNRVLSAYDDGAAARLPMLDILEEVKRHLGYRVSLDALSVNTLGVAKSGSGLLALQWFREGRLNLLAEYCRKDVELTRDLFLFGWRQRYLLFRNKAGQVVRCPVDFRRQATKVLMG